MKVLLINGSPRWKGNTNRALEEAAAALEAEGVQTELVWIGNKEIRGCIACGICGKTGDKHCVFAEDCCNELIAKAAKICADDQGADILCKSRKQDRRRHIAGYL